MFFLIFKGKGPLVILSALVGWGITAFLNHYVLGRFCMIIPGGFFLQYMINVLAIAGVNYEATKHFCKPREYKEIGPDGLERTTIVKDPSHLFYIPNRVWTWIFLIGGTLWVLYRFLSFRL